MAEQIDPERAELERARIRRDQAAPGSPDWDAASQAVIELEERDPSPLVDQLRRRVFFVESPSSH
jgi:hypothetical protein